MVPYIGRFESLQVFIITLPALTDVHVGDHIVLTSSSDHPNMHLEVQAEMAPESFEIERNVIATEIGTATHA